MVITLSDLKLLVNPTVSLDKLLEIKASGINYNESVSKLVR
jgi:hypothetical protein